MPKANQILLQAVILFLLATPICAQWDTMQGCRLIQNEYNDGDSFHFEKDGKEFIARLYFVDTPETDNTYPERVAEQAAHHGKSIEETIYIGRYAKQVTAQLLSKPFAVVTRYQDALGRSKLHRIYAFIATADGEDLGEILVKNGLARSHGTAGAPPGKTIAVLRATYDKLENAARSQMLGIYSPDPLHDIKREK